MSTSPSETPRDARDPCAYPDEPLLSPGRLYRALWTYLWWVEMHLKTETPCGGFACHLVYYRREYARHVDGAGYDETLLDLLRRRGGSRTHHTVSED